MYRRKKKKEENNKRVENWVNQSGWRRKVMRKKQCPAQIWGYSNAT